MRKLVPNDKWALSQLAGVLASADGAMTKPDLQRLLSWKLARGTYRGALPGLLASTREDVVPTATAEAWALVASLSKKASGAKIDAVLTDAVGLLAAKEMRGCGPALASAWLAIVAPWACPFMADEALEGAGYTRDYKLKTLLVFASDLRARAKKLGASWSAEMVGQALWSAAKASELGVEAAATAEAKKPTTKRKAGATKASTASPSVSKKAKNA